MKLALLNWPLRAALLGLCFLAVPGAELSPSFGAAASALAILSAPTLIHRSASRLLMVPFSEPESMAPLGFIVCFAISAPLFAVSAHVVGGAVFSGGGSELACASLFSLACSLLPASIAELPRRTERQAST